MQLNIAFTFIALIGSTLGVITTLVILVIMILHLRRERDVALLLIANTYLTLFAFSIFLFSTSIHVLRADLFGVAILDDGNMGGCRFQGFMLYVTCGCCNTSFVLQAFYRLARVIYPKRKFLQVCPSTTFTVLTASCPSLDILVQLRLRSSRLAGRVPSAASYLLLATTAPRVLSFGLLLQH